MSSSNVSTPAVSTSSERFTGRVKWFNNKAGYGFITVTDGSTSGTDVFVHHSSIKVDSEQYKYLVQGEYVDFNLSDTKTTNHEFQAGEVCGIKGGKLMCETRRDSRVARSQYHLVRPDENSEPVKMPRSVSTPNNQRDTGTSGEWSQVSNTRKTVDSFPPTQRVSSGRGRGSDSRGRGSDSSRGRGSGRGSRGEGRGQSS
jgi:CspA family cold shock protein